MLVVEGIEVRLDDDAMGFNAHPKYSDMMQRLGRDPMGRLIIRHSCHGRPT